MKKLTKYVSVVVLSAAFALSTPLNYMENISYAESVSNISSEQTSESVVKMKLPKGKVYNLQIFDITDYYREFMKTNGDLKHDDLVKKLRDMVISEKDKDFTLVLEYLDVKDWVSVTLDNNKAYLVVDKDGHIVPFVIVGDYDLNGEAIEIFPKDSPSDEPDEPDEPDDPPEPDEPDEPEEPDEPDEPEPEKPDEPDEPEPEKPDEPEPPKKDEDKPNNPPKDKPTPRKSSIVETGVSNAKKFVKNNWGYLVAIMVILAAFFGYRSKSKNKKIDDVK